jgi:PAS domain S-box-containing protein
MTRSREPGEVIPSTDPTMADPAGRTASDPAPESAPDHRPVVTSLLSAIADATTDLVYLKDPAGRYIMVNRALRELAGRDADALVGRTPREVFGADLGDALLDHDRQVLESGQPALFDEHLTIAGTTHLYSSSKAPFYDDAGRLAGVVGISRDITDLRRLEEVVSAARQREADDRFRGVLDTMLDLVTIQRVVRDEGGAIVDFVIEFMNQVNIDVAGRPREELVGGSVLTHYPAMAGSPLFAAYVRAVETQQPVIFDELAWEDTIDGQEVSGAYAVQIVPFGDGLVICARDISETIRNHAQLSDAFEQLNAAQSLAHIGIWSIDLTADEITFSDELYRIFGLEPGSVLPSAGQALAELIDGDDTARVRALLDRLQATDEPVSAEIRIRRRDGFTRQVTIFGAASRESGGTGRLWGTAQDVTDQRQAEDALREASRSLSQEHQTVTLLQRAILPVLSEATAAEVAAIYLPAGGESQVGGDWYDAFELDAHRLGVVVGDVAGHGVPAAGLMAQIRNALRAHAFNELGPAATFTALNRLLERTHAPGFATCLYAVLDSRTRQLTWARAGHPPFMVHRSGSTERFERPGDPPLGALPGHQYAEASVELRADDLLLLYTDGLFERRRQGIDARLDQLADELGRVAGRPVDEVCERLCTAMLEGESAEDDRCVLVMRVA